MKRNLALITVVLAVALLSLSLVSGGKGQAAGPQAVPLDVVISEVAWAGTAASTYDEWIELYNNTAAAIDLSGWTLAAVDGTPNIALAGVIPANGYFLLERSDDTTVSDIPADQIFTGAIGNTGEVLELRDGASTLVDSADGSGGWPGGSISPGYYSMERIDPATADISSNWASNDGVTRNGLDADGNPLNGTPKARNSATPLPGADLRLVKGGPATALPGERITYTITFSNAGQLAAGTARLTDVLPAQVSFSAHSAPYPFSQPVAGTLVWELGTVATTTASTPLTFTISGQVDGTAVGELTNLITITSATTETNPADNHDDWLTLVGSPPLTPVVVIEALHYDGYETGELDEAVRVMNVSTTTANLDGWRLTDGSAAAIFAPGTSLAAGQAIWCTREATAFARQFGFQPDFETDDTDATVPEMNGSWPGFANDGDECVLKGSADEMVDALVYKSGSTATAGWIGASVEPWTPSNTFAAEGQILYRKRDQASGLPVPDTDTAADWAQDPNDHIDGRKALYPGWDLDDLFFTQRVTETAVLTVGVAPDNLFESLSLLLAGAHSSIRIEGYTLHSKEMADVLLERLGQGVDVAILLEGSPAVEGITDQEKWIAQQLHNAGATILFMINDSDADIYDRYKYQHAKLIIVDGHVVAIGSENLNYTSIPADDKGNGTAGRRGVYLITDAPGVVARAQAIFEADADPANHVDLVTCDQALDLCAPSAGYQPELTPDWITYTVQFSQSFATSGEMSFEVIHAPENGLRDRDSLLGLLSRAGAGDTILTEQFYEYSFWGPADGTPATDPNPRLEAYIDAARRGAAVRILLDRYFDSGENLATMAYLRGIASMEGLDLQVRRGNPTYLGLHNKMVLAHVGGRGYVHVGSINGSEASSKLNREVALQVQSDGAYGYLQAVFDYDWIQSVPPVYVPLVCKSYTAPKPANDILVSEVYYSASPEHEWVEIVNPTNEVIDLSFYKVGDAQDRLVFEGMYKFPVGTTLGPHQTIVIAGSATVFRQDHPGRDPDFEFYETAYDVPNMMDYPLWGTGEWHLGNSGDEVLVVNEDDVPVDVLVYGTGSYPGVTPHPGVAVYTHSLERFPYQYDSDDCSVDFRDWPFPNPGELP